MRASFKTLDEANAYSLAVKAAWAAGGVAPSVDDFLAGFAGRREVTVAPGMPTRLDELVDAALEAHRRNKHLDESSLLKPRGQWAKHGHVLGNPDIRDLTRSDVHRFADYLYEQRLAKRTAQEYIRLVLKACDLAMEANLVPANVAAGVSARFQDNPRRPLNRTQPRPLTPVQVKALAAQFKPWLQLAILLMYVQCLRLSEVFGLELRDWDPVERILSVRRQGGLKKNEGRRDPSRPDEADGRLKSRSSRRKIPVPPVLAEVIDRHIADFHGPRPVDPVGEATWLRRRLISRNDMPKPRSGVVVDPWKDALRAVGLDFDTVGFHIDRHFLRKSGSTQIGIGNIRGKLWSSFLGHKTPAEFGGSLTTVRHYFDLPDGELRVVADRWEQVIRDSVTDLVIREDWWTAPHMTLGEAAAALGLHHNGLRSLITRGHILLAPDEEVTGWRHRAGVRNCADRVMISGPSVREELERRRSRESRMTLADVAHRLGISRYYIRELLKRGVLRAAVCEDTRWSFEAKSVEVLAGALLAEEAENHLYVGAGEAARLAGLAEYEFAKVYDDRIRGRTLILTRQRQYLREDVESLARRRG